MPKVSIPKVEVKSCSKSFGNNKLAKVACKQAHNDTKTRDALKEAKQTAKAVAAKPGHCGARGVKYAEKVKGAISDAKRKGPNKKVRSKVGTLEAGRQIQGIEKHCT